MPDGATGDFYISVQGATNAALGQNGQGVCGVKIRFDHEWIGDLEMKLVSPSGQSVTLVGPITLFSDETDATKWDVVFVRCSQPANPDPGLQNAWDNSQGWGIAGNYKGTYYPQAGCLEDFNTGPVNGIWSLKVTDNLPFDVGNIIDYEIIFCDPSGINCASCMAEAGNLTQADIALCKGDTALDLSLPPTYAPSQKAPPVADYAYTYVISGAGGVILAYDSTANLRTRAAGDYTVCGLSYLRSDAARLPAPDGKLTFAALNAQLSSSTPPFCGKMTVNCVNVTIFDRPDDTVDAVDICAPDCYTFMGQQYCESDTIVVEMTQNQCKYTATLYLRVRKPVVTNLSETICGGGCSATPGFENACASGMYQQMLKTAGGCDSIVNLDLKILEPMASIETPDALRCGADTVLLVASDLPANAQGASFHWAAFDGSGVVGADNQIKAAVNQVGAYLLSVCMANGNQTCCDSAQVDVALDTQKPEKPILPSAVNLCKGQIAIVEIGPVAHAEKYVWSLPVGATPVSGLDSLQIRFQWDGVAAGQLCVRAENGCGAGEQACAPVLNNPGAIADAGPDRQICGLADTLTALSKLPEGGWSFLSGPGVAVFDAPGEVVSPVSVDVAGLYRFIRADSSGSCVGRDTVAVAFNEKPSASNVLPVCDAQNERYTVTFMINGGTAPFKASNGTIEDGVFTSSPIDKGSAYSFIVQDANNCATEEVKGEYDCVCTAEAGTMNLTPLVLCAGSRAEAVWNNDGVVEQNNLLAFVLHDMPGDTLGNIKAVSHIAMFEFSDSIQPNATYYISAVVGRDMNGQVDLNDPCLSVSRGTPVRWNALPFASMIGGAVVCSGDSATLTFQGTGVFPLSLTYTTDQGKENTLALNDDQPLRLTVPQAAAQFYALLSVSDSNTPVCSIVASDTARVTLAPPVRADAGPDLVLDCQRTFVFVGGDSTTKGQGVRYGWQKDGAALVGATKNAYKAVETGLYKLIVTDQYGCVATDTVRVGSNTSMPEIIRYAAKDAVCHGDNNGYIRVDSVAGGTPPYFFALNAARFTIENEFSGLWPGGYIVNIQDANGCQGASDTVYIKEPPKLSVDLGPDINLNIGDSLQVNMESSISDMVWDSIVWSPLLDMAAEGKPWQLVKTPRSVVLSVTAYDSSGCSASDKVTIVVNKNRRIYIPNIFKPESEGLIVYGGADVSEIESFAVYDRWGEQMFRAENFQPNDPGMAWDGRFKGGFVQPGVYVYRVDVRYSDGALISVYGDVMVYR